MYADIGGMDIQKQEVREAVELPLTHFELYKQVRRARRQGREVLGPRVGDNLGSSFSHLLDWHRSSPRCPHVWPSWLRKDNVSKGCGTSHDR